MNPENLDIQSAGVVKSNTNTTDVHRSLLDEVSKSVTRNNITKFVNSLSFWKHKLSEILKINFDHMFREIQKQHQAGKIDMAAAKVNKL